MKDAHPSPKKEAGAKDKANSTFGVLRSPRQRRVLAALLEAPGWISREAIDRIAGASNGPQVILELRRVIGFDQVEMQRRRVVDRDGRASRPGAYRLTAQGRILGASLMS